MTPKMNRCLNLWCRMVADELNDQGYDMREVKVEIKPTEQNIKESFVKPVMNSLYPEHDSTMQMTDKQVTELYDVLNKALGMRLGIYIGWPSLENQSNEKLLK